MSRYSLAEQFQEARATLRTRRIGLAIARTACFNVSGTAATALSGVIIARGLGPAVRGEYTAVLSWFGLLVLIGEVGQSAAVVFYVAHEPTKAPGYLATSRTLMLSAGLGATALGFFLAPHLAHGDARLASAYRIAYSGSVVAFLGCSYVAALQARNTGQWNLVQASQPAVAFAAIIVLDLMGLLSLKTAIAAIIMTWGVQLGYAYYACRENGLVPGRFQLALVRPVARYGLSQLAAVTPTTVNLYLDTLVLSQLVPPADLGRYSVAVAITALPVPLVSAIGNVAFPRLAAQRTSTAGSRRLQLGAAAASAGVAAAVTLPLAAIAPWLIPAVFGPAYRGAVPLLWILTPGGIFLASGQVVGDLLRGLNQARLVAVAQGLAAVFTLVLLLLLLPSTGVAAAAIASSVAYGVALCVMVRWLWRPPQRRLDRGRHRRGDRTGSLPDRPEPQPLSQISGGAE